MLSLTLGQTAEDIIVTLSEKRTLDTGYYLFVFEHGVTKDIVNKIFAFSDDESDYQDRYNSFEINTNTVFSGKPPGDWLYKVYEQASSSNTNTSGLTEVERGILKLNAATEFEYEQYNETTSYKVYGQ